MGANLPMHPHFHGKRDQIISISPAIFPSESERILLFVIEIQGPLPLHK
jgi:hypothetical protein